MNSAAEEPNNGVISRSAATADRDKIISKPARGNIKRFINRE